MLKAIFFDLDGTLLPFNEDDFIKLYFHLLSEKVCTYGYEKEALIKHVWAGTKLMYQNNGEKSNEQVFWDYFSSIYGEKALNDKPYFDAFYINEFKQVKQICKENIEVRKIIDEIKALDLKIILSTNPLFPYQGTLTRCSFVGLKEDDFDFITAYENSSYCKPNPKYYASILEKFNLKADEVILFGNNDFEDGIAQKALGIKTYMVGDYIIHNQEHGIDLPHIKFNEIIDIIKQHL